MRYRFVVLLVLAAAGCGKEIGDDCAFHSDCDPNGERICDLSSTDGYCTIQGCDYFTCPEEAVCVQFFTGSFGNSACDPLATAEQCLGTSQPDGVCCSLDELCAIDGHCVARASESRYCMRTCGSDGDCRDGYECRDLTRMIEHGGQPVLAPNEVVDENAPKFCAQAVP